MNRHHPFTGASSSTVREPVVLSYFGGSSEHPLKLTEEPAENADDARFAAIDRASAEVDEAVAAAWAPERATLRAQADWQTRLLPHLRDARVRPALPPALVLDAPRAEVTGEPGARVLVVRTGLDLSAAQLSHLVAPLVARKEQVRRSHA